MTRQPPKSAAPRRRCFTLIPCGKKDCYLCWPEKALAIARDAKLQKARERVVKAAQKYVDGPDDGGWGRYTTLARAVQALRRAEGGK